VGTLLRSLEHPTWHLVQAVSQHREETAPEPPRHHRRPSDLTGNPRTPYDLHAAPDHGRRDTSTVNCLTFDQEHPARVPHTLADGSNRGRHRVDRHLVVHPFST